MFLFPGAAFRPLFLLKKPAFLPGRILKQEKKPKPSDLFIFTFSGKKSFFMKTPLEEAI
jgi:hypothetical protein